MRTAIVSLMKSEDRLIGKQKRSFIEFDGNVEEAAEAFEAAETANADQLAQILDDLDRGVTSGSGGSTTSPVIPTPVGNTAPAANSGTDAGASSNEPVQNAPSAI